MLTARNLTVTLNRKPAPIKLLEDLSFTLQPGEIVGLAGESGSGKSLLALALMGLLPEGASATGEILLDAQNLTTLNDRAYSRLRGKSIAMVFQEPMRALNPLQPVNAQIAEAIRQHGRLTNREALNRAGALLDQVGLPANQVPRRARPHQLSGGQLQRVMIAVALAGDPAILLADECSTALDPVAQAQILALLASLAKARNMALLIISHDLGLIAQITQRLMVLYAGRLVESGPSHQLLTAPAHPYTKALLSASLHTAHTPGTRLPTLTALPPDLRQPYAGCRFAPQCPRALPVCPETFPATRTLPHGRSVACHAPLEAA